MKNRQSIDQMRKALPERERRYVPIDDGAGIEYRQGEDGAPKILMFVPFNSRSVDLYGFTESIAPGAFAKTIKDRSRGKAERNTDIVALWNHDPLWVLARQANQTLAIQETREGLEAVAELDGDDSMHRHFARMIETRRVQGTSFGFNAIRDEWDYEEDGEAVHRTLLEVRLFEVSPVTFPAYPKSDAEARAAGVGAAAVALARNGLDLGDLAALLAGTSRGVVVAARTAELRQWIDRLSGFLPTSSPVPIPAPPTEPLELDWTRLLDLRNRRIGGCSPRP
jgi:hypothetical protein